jgi:AraC-like DNA-binding protein
MAGKNADDIGEEIIEIFLVLTGEVTINGNGFRILLEKNSLYCFCRNEGLETEVKPGTVGYVIRFSKHLLYADEYELHRSDLSAFHALVLRDEIIKVDTSHLKEGKKICEMMYHEFKYHNAFSTQILSGFLGIFLLHMIRKSNLFIYITGKKTQHTLVRRFNALLEQEFKTSKRVSYYARMLSVTPSHLNEIIKQTTGRSAGSHIRQRVVLEAVHQARLRGASLKEVAYDLGFTDNAHFSKFFKKIAGANFSDIKRSCYTASHSLSSEGHALSIQVF